MRRLVVFSAVSIAAALAGTGIANSEPGRSDGRQDRLAEVRRATAKFHRIEAAEAAGYVNPGAAHCVEVPGLGGMGVHVINPELVFDGVLEATEPEVLLYAPSPSGDLQLVGVEYLMPVSEWTRPSAPDLFGRPFDGPMPEHEPGTTGDHYDQHVWIWSHNPDGILATWNRAIDCP